MERSVGDHCSSPGGSRVTDRSGIADSSPSSLFGCQGGFFGQDFPSWPEVLQNTDEEVDASE